MSSCEKCWGEAVGNADRYSELVKINNCTPEEQAGFGAMECEHCNREAVHVITGECMNCGIKEQQ